MKFDFDTVLKNADGKDMVEGDKPAKVRVALSTALLADVDGVGQPLRGEAKLARYNLWQKLASATPDSDFSIAEVQQMQDAAKVFPTLVYGQLHYFLEGASNG